MCSQQRTHRFTNQRRRATLGFTANFVFAAVACSFDILFRSKFTRGKNTGTNPAHTKFPDCPRKLSHLKIVSEKQQLSAVPSFFTFVQYYNHSNTNEYLLESSEDGLLDIFYFPFTALLKQNYIHIVKWRGKNYKHKVLEIGSEIGATGLQINPGFFQSNMPLY